MDYKDWRTRFERLVAKSEEDLDIAEGALIIAADEYPELDVARYIARLDKMAGQVRSHLPRDRNPQETVGVLNRYLFRELGFAGNRENYYDPRNSYLNDVLERKLGLPLTLSVVYLTVGRRLGLPLFGVGLPGHFIVKWEDDRSLLLIDPFYRGEILDEAGVEGRVRDTFHAQARFQPEWLTTVDAKYILIRLLNNLKAIFVQTQDLTRAWQAVDKLLILDPRSPENIRDMGLLSIHVKAFRNAAIYLEEYLLSHADAEDAEQLRIYLRTALAAVERLN
jgi:regulator of sirC expression with transglutaminase-like and TPR domain